MSRNQHDGRAASVFWQPPERAKPIFLGYAASKPEGADWDHGLGSWVIEADHVPNLVELRITNDSVGDIPEFLKRRPGETPAEFAARNPLDPEVEARLKEIRDRSTARTYQTRQEAQPGKEDAPSNEEEPGMAAAKKASAPKKGAAKKTSTVGSAIGGVRNKSVSVGKVGDLRPIRPNTDQHTVLKMALAGPVSVEKIAQKIDKRVKDVAQHLANLGRIGVGFDIEDGKVQAHLPGSRTLDDVTRSPEDEPKPGRKQAKEPADPEGGEGSEAA